MKQYAQVYVLGIGGAAMSALARLFLQRGKKVFGHDSAPSYLTDQLIAEGIPIHFEADPAAIPVAIIENPEDTLVLYTASIDNRHPIFQYLSERNYVLRKRDYVLSMLTQEHYTLAIAGTHGKTMSTTLAAHILHYAETNVTAFLGGVAKNYGTNFITAKQHIDDDSKIVIEADEFDRFFLTLHPDVAIITNIDADHLEIYGDQTGFDAGFQQFLGNIDSKGMAIVHQTVFDRLHLAQSAQRFAVIPYALQGATVHADHLHINGEGKFVFDYISPAINIVGIQLPIPGYHQVENALAVITACLHMGIAPEIIKEAIHTFQGVSRRSDLILQQNGVVLIDDYAHHPVEIAAFLQTMRITYPGKKLTVVFQPNQYSRTQDFLPEIAASLDIADCVLISDIYSDRETPIPGISPATILAHMQCAHKYTCTFDSLPTCLAKAGPHEVVVNLGAGDAGKFVASIKAFLVAHCV